MSQENINISLNISTGGGAKSLSDLRGEVRQLNQAMSDAAKSGDKLTFDKLKKELSITQHSMRDLRQELRYLDEGFAGAVAMGRHLTGSMMAVNGVMTLLGSNNEKLNDVIRRFAGLTQLVTGLGSIQNLVQSKGLILAMKQHATQLLLNAGILTQTTVTKGATVAQLAFNKAAYANPYVLLAAAIIAVAVALALFIKRQRESTQETKNNVEATSDYIVHLSDLEKQMIENIAKQRLLNEESKDYQTTIANLTNNLSGFATELELAAMVSGDVDASMNAFHSAMERKQIFEGYINQLSDLRGELYEYQTIIKQLESDPFAADRENEIAKIQSKAEQTAEGIKVVEDYVKSLQKEWEKVGVKVFPTSGDVKRIGGNTNKIRDNYKQLLIDIEKLTFQIQFNIFTLENDMVKMVIDHIDSFKLLSANGLNTLLSLRYEFTNRSKELELLELQNKISLKKSEIATLVGLEKQKAELELQIMEDQKKNIEVKYYKEINEMNQRYLDDALNSNKEYVERVAEIYATASEKGTNIIVIRPGGEFEHLKIKLSELNTIYDNFFVEMEKRRDNHLDFLSEMMDKAGIQEEEKQKILLSVTQQYNEKIINERQDLSRKIAEIQRKEYEHLLKNSQNFQREQYAEYARRNSERLILNKKTLDKAVEYAKENYKQMSEITKMLGETWILLEVENEKKQLEILEERKKNGIISEEEYGIERIKIKSETNKKLIEIENSTNEELKLINEEFLEFEKSLFLKREEFMENLRNAAIDSVKEFNKSMFAIFAENEKAMTEFLLRELSLREEARRTAYEEDVKRINSLAGEEVITANERDEKLKEMRKKEAIEKYQIQLQEFQTKKKNALVEIAINTAIGLLKNIAQLGFVASIPVNLLTLASGVAAGIVINNQKPPQPPKFEFGGLINGKRHSSGGTLVNVEDGEAIINRRSMANPYLRNLASMINEAGGGRRFAPATTALQTTPTSNIDVENIVSEVVSKIVAIPVVVSEGDITRTQRKISVIEEESKLG